MPGLANVVVVVWKEDVVLLISVDVTDELDVVESALELKQCGGRGGLCRCGACAHEARGHEEHTLSPTGKKGGLTSNKLNSKLLESILRTCHPNQTTIYFGQVTSIVERLALLLLKTEKRL
jgi:hypothetical protein